MYQISFTKEASKDLKKLDKKFLSAVDKALNKLSLDPKVGFPLVGQLKGYWKLRFSNYRIIYQIFEKKLLIIVFEIKHRKEVYKKL